MNNILEMVQSGDAWAILTIACYVIAIVCLFISIVLAGLWNLSALWDELSGTRKKREIANYNEKYSQKTGTIAIDQDKFNKGATGALAQRIWSNKDVRELNINNRNLTTTVESAEEMANANRAFVMETMSSPEYYEQYNAEDNGYVPEHTAIQNRLSDEQIFENLRSQMRGNKGSVYNTRQENTYDMAYDSDAYEQPTGYINTENYEQPTGYISPENYEQPTGYISPENYEQPTGYIKPNGYEEAYEQPTGFINNEYEQITGSMETGEHEQPTGFINSDYEQPTGFINNDYEQPTGFINNDYEQPTGYLDSGMDYRNTYMSRAGQLRNQKETKETLLRDILAADTSGSAFKALQKTVAILSNEGGVIAPNILVAGGSEEEDSKNNLNIYNV